MALLPRLIKLVAVVSCALVLSGCAGLFSRLFAPVEEPPVVYQTEFRAVSIPSSFFDGCPRYVNPPRSVSDGIENEEDERQLGLWMTVNNENYAQCEITIRNAANENDAITESINELNARLEQNAVDQKN